MKRWIAVGMIAVLSATGVRGDGQTARGRAAAVAVEKGPALDGTLADPAWRKCPPLPMGACTSADPLALPTSARLLFDPTHVYVAVRCEEPDTTGMPANAAGRDGAVWQDDSVEILLRADPEMPYRHFAVNSRGALYDALEKDSSWNSSAEARCSVEQGQAWTMTFRVPLKELDAYVGTGQTWTVNIHRSRQPRGGSPLLEYSWAIMNSTQFHSPDEFGIVEGVSVPKRDNGVTRIRETPPPAPLTSETGAESGGVTVYRKQSFSGTTEGWESSAGGKLSLTDSGADGQALRVDCDGQWSGAQLPLRVAGSTGLRLAYHMKVRGLPYFCINAGDKLSNDNTTSYAYQYLSEGEWVPVLYFLDQFRYNSRSSGVVGGRTSYRGINLFCPDKTTGKEGFDLDNVVLYRGVDLVPPGPVTGLRAKVSADGVALAWEAAPDNVCPMVYAVARAGDSGGFVKIGETCTTAFLDRGAPRGACRYRVLAVDFEENLGPWCKPVEAPSTADPAAREPSMEERDRGGYAAHVREVHARGAGKVRRGRAAMFGDSLTYATTYRQTAQSAFLNLSVNAFGYPSMRTGFGKDNIARILQEDNPEYICILFGTNNGKSPADIGAAMADLEAIVAAAEANGTVALLGTIPPRGFADPASAPEAAYNHAVAELGRKLKVPVAYIFESLQAAGERHTYIAGDGVHWNGDGMRIAGLAWGRALAQTRFALRDRE